MQEVASRGLVLIYDLAGKSTDQDTQKKLVSDLVQTIAEVQLNQILYLFKI